MDVRIERAAEKRTMKVEDRMERQKERTRGGDRWMERTTEERRMKGNTMHEAE